MSANAPIIKTLALALLLVLCVAPIGQQASAIPEDEDYYSRYHYGFDELDPSSKEAVFRADIAFGLLGWSLCLGTIAMVSVRRLSNMAQRHYCELQYLMHHPEMFENQLPKKRMRTPVRKAVGRSLAMVIAMFLYWCALPVFTFLPILPSQLFSVLCLAAIIFLVVDVAVSVVIAGKERKWYRELAKRFGTSEQRQAVL